MVRVHFSGKKEREGLYFLIKNKKINADLHLQVLKEHMLNFYCIYGSEMVMHNNVPFHKAKKVTRYLEQTHINIF